MSHFEERMDNDLQAIRAGLWQLGEDVEAALRNAKKVLILRDAELAYATVLADGPINRDSRECDRLCHTFIARHLPGAGPLRELASTSRVNVALERVGDYAVTICREALQLKVPLPEALANRIDLLFDESIAILAESRKSFRDGNAEAAIALMQMAKRVEGGMDSLYETLYAQDERMDGATMMAIFVVFSLLKRVADQAKNICDQTVYAVKGIAKMPKTYRILFLDQAASGVAQLATAIARKNYPQSGYFMASTAGASEDISSELQQFLEQTGLPDEDLKTEQLEVIEYDLGEYTVVVSLNGKVEDYLDKIPFHTSALNWNVTAGDDRSQQYRLLRDEIQQLMTLLAGSEAG
ncbi:MAG: hypothetical protein L3J22_08275 [Xanthomonadales bacterium]|nr:hypothetical protein [Xanthomonadales bacterium]